MRWWYKVGQGGGGDFPYFWDQFGGKEKRKEGRRKIRYKRKRRKNGEEEGRKEEKGRKRFSQRSDDRSLTVLELKSVHEMRATRGYQNQGVSSNSKR